MENENYVQSCIVVDNYSNSSPYSNTPILINCYTDNTIRIITVFTAIITTY